jgi:hypothetical protein
MAASGSNDAGYDPPMTVNPRKDAFKTAIMEYMREAGNRTVELTRFGGRVAAFS